MRRWGLALVLVAAAGGRLAAQSKISTKFADVIMEYVIPGKIYNLHSMRSLPYRVVNDSAGPTDVSITIKIPQKDQLKPGYEALPDPTWLRVVPNKLHLEPGEHGLADVILQVPVDPKFEKRHFQAHILTENAEPPFSGATTLAFTIAVESRLRFSVKSPGPEQIRRMQKAGIYQMLNFTLEPEALYVPGFFAPGARANITKQTGSRLSLINRSSQKLAFSLKSVQPPSGIGPAAGYVAAPDPSWLKIKPEGFKIAGDSMKSFGLELDIPDRPELRGKRLAFFVQATLEGREIPVEIYSRVYVNISD
ncbi:MAG: hypothetical protein PHF00_09525 [Elusimicrobia bacterium]|nr:hypothetical protein [Elusimicrobiota bacterium]